MNIEIEGVSKEKFETIFGEKVHLQYICSCDPYIRYPDETIVGCGFTEYYPKYDPPYTATELIQLDVSERVIPIGRGLWEDCVNGFTFHLKASLSGSESKEEFDEFEKTLSNLIDKNLSNLVKGEGLFKISEHDTFVLDKSDI